MSDNNLDEIIERNRADANQNKDNTLKPDTIRRENWSYAKRLRAPLTT